MAKKKKTEIRMIDMTSRTYIKIVESTLEEEESLQKDLDEAQRIVEERMFQYEQYIKRLINDSISSYIIDTKEKDADYFIEMYHKQFETRNTENIKNKIEQYQRFLKEQDK